MSRVRRKRIGHTNSTNLSLFLYFTLMIANVSRLAQQHQDQPFVEIMVVLSDEIGDAGKFGIHMIHLSNIGGAAGITGTVRQRGKHGRGMGTRIN